LLGYTYLDSGAMYRALALKANRRGVSLTDAAALEALARETHIDLQRGADGLRVLLDGEDVTLAIRTAEVFASGFACRDCSWCATGPGGRATARRQTRRSRDGRP